MSYGINFGFRIHPEGGERHGRYSIATELPNGVPVVTTGSFDTNGRAIVALAGAAATTPLPGKGGLLIHEIGPDAYNGRDPVLTNLSDISTAPAGSAVQVIFGAKEVKVWLKNTTTGLFLHQRTYTGRKIVAGVGATPTLVVGDMLTPGTGNDTAGYWAKTTDPTLCWLVVTSVDSTADTVEAQLNF